MSPIDRVYVLNLKGRREKKDRISDLLFEESLGIPIKFIEAFDLRYLDINLLHFLLQEQGCKVYPRWKTEKFEVVEGFNFIDWDNREITSGEIGCSLSHIHIWKNASSKHENVLILEDDAFWRTGELKKFITESLPKCPETDILYLGRNKVSKKEEPHVDEGKLFVSPSLSYNTHSYIITHSGASKLLSLKPHENIIPSDEFLAASWTKHRRSDIRQVFPPSLKALSSDQSKFEIWQQSLPSGYNSDIERKSAYASLYGKKIYCFTAADNALNEGLEKNLVTAKNNNVSLKILGLNSPWGGGDMVSDPGGGQKINLLIPELENLKNDPDAIVLFVDGYDVLFLDSLDRIVSLFLSKNAPILFSAEKSCWPDKSLANKYPKSPYEYRFLNSGTFIGYAKDLCKVTQRAKDENLPNIADDQLYYTLEFLNGKHRDLISLDYKCEIFQCLGWSYGDVEIENNRLHNAVTNTRPMIAHGNSNKENFWYLSNYLTEDWNKGSPFSPIGMIKDDPIIYISLYCVANLSEANWNTFFNHIKNLNYPKHKIILHIEDSQGRLQTIKEPIDAKEYREVFYTATKVNESEVRNEIFKESLNHNYDYHFYIENLCLLENPETLNELIKTNKNVVAPVLREIIKGEESPQCNFWGAFSESGYYKQSDNYFDILDRKDKKCWTVPFVGACYLIKRKIIEDYPNPYKGGKDLDLSFVKNLGYKRVLFHADNRHNYGIINWKY